MLVIDRVRLRAIRPTRAEPAVGDVDVRLVDLGAGGDVLTLAESFLTADELARARRGTPPVHRRRVLLRAALRSALGAQLAMDPGSVPLGTSPTGRPFPASPAGDAVLDVSCSASGTLGIVVVGHACRVGVDVERVGTWSPEVLDEGWLSADEREALLVLPPAARAEAASRSWTQKEAVLKARGTGLGEHPATVVTEIGRRVGVVDGWGITDVHVPDGWVASLAVGRLKESPE
jgi:4'-phosphopantetheinyl transferase